MARFGVFCAENWTHTPCWVMVILMKQVFLSGLFCVGCVSGNTGDSADTNRLPSIEAVAIFPETIFEASVVECVAQGWLDPDGDAPLFSLEWLINGEVVDSIVELEGELFNKGDVLSCTLTPLDAYGSGIPQTAETVVQNTLPVAERVVVRPERVDVTSTLRVEIQGEQDDDQDAVTWSHEWFVNAEPRSSSPLLSGAALRRGDKVYALSTPYDGEEEGKELQSEEIEVQNAVPIVSSVTIYPSEPRPTDLLSAIVSTDDGDGDGVSLEYSWSLNSEEVGSGATLSSSFVSGDSISVRVRPSDGVDVGEWVESDPTFVQSN